ncbi:hypothetical protein [Flavobacterium sp. PL002]|uniref:hypothetical protein n=1 Tax=Flavobacterium sp. PL002 TaxID=1897058 RepID=UPI001787A90C|nr:hypothetical protein [Flavobacterium sp. PL002]MBE0390550.1 hypothetical protein [Flavobacterium sp. PL002]
MKTKILLLSLATTVFALQSQAQNSTRVNAANYEISDNLDLRAVASIFGDSRDIQDFERKLNDPEIQISNLDLNNDDEVDYLRVIETVENKTHLVVIQAVLDRDVYQDVATIDLERDHNNKVQIQFVGNEFMYGSNYIYEPVYYSTPAIYASFWTSNYRPYVSSYNWNYYPTYYNAWNPYPVYRYRNNISVNININNRYNYVNSRRSNQAVVIYNSRRSNGYERLHPNYAFSRRNTTVINRYELDQSRSPRRISSRSEVGYNNRNSTSRTVSTRRPQNERVYSQNRVTTSRESEPTRREYSQRTSTDARPVRTTTQRDYSQRRTTATTPQRESSNTSRSRESTPQRTETRRSSSQGNGSSTRQSSSQRTESNRATNSRESNSVSSRSENRRS